MNWRPMRIRTQFIVTMFLFGVVLVAIFASVVITNQKVRKANEQAEIASSIAQGAGDLSYLASDYVIYRESQQLNRWQTRYALFSSDVAELQTDNPEQQAVVRNIQENAQRLKEVFDSVISQVRTTSQNQDGPIDPALLRISWSRMSVQSQVLSSDASRLSQLLSNQVKQLHSTNTIIVIALIGVFIAYILINYGIMQRRVLKGIANLQTGAAVIGSGNLDFQIEEKGSDEIGDLSHAFSRMTADLKTVTASKIDLESEVEQRKKAEEALRQSTIELATANKELEAFSYSVSHDLRAPLRSIDGFSQALLEDYAHKLDEQGKNYLQRVRSATQRMGDLIDDLLILSRVTRSEMKLQTVDLSTLANSIAAELKKTQPERSVEFVITPGLSANGDAHLLRLLLENLLGNAWKFTAKRAKAKIEFGASRVNGRRAFLVRDDGAGFDMTYVDKLFTPFQRLHSGNEFPGTGIGLATVQRIVNRHGGRVWAEGEVEKGATVYFMLGRIQH
jgi:signal transduction histidine kinase